MQEKNLPEHKRDMRFAVLYLVGEKFSCRQLRVPLRKFERDILKHFLAFGIRELCQNFDLFCVFQTIFLVGSSAAQNLELPKLPYAYNALEPTIDEATMRLHHLGHHAGEK